MDIPLPGDLDSLLPIGTDDLSPSAIVAWVDSAQDDSKLKAIENALKIYAQGASRTPKVTSAKLLRPFGVLLQHYLTESGYPNNTDKQAALLAQTLPGLQDPPRSLPYDRLLVQSWLEGKNLPTEEAWESVQFYFNSDKKNAPPHAISAMLALYETISDLYEIIKDKNPFMGELQETALVRYKEAQNKGLTSEKISMALAKTGNCISQSLSRAFVSDLMNGKSELEKERIIALDELYREYGLDCEPSLLCILLYERHKKSLFSWDRAETFGEMLRTVRQHYSIKFQELSGVLGLSEPAVFKWEKCVLAPDKDTIACPDEENFQIMLEHFCHAEDTLRQTYPDSYIPFLTEDRIAKITQARDKLYINGKRNINLTHSKIADKTLAEVALLHKKAPTASLKEIAAVLEVKGNKAPANIVARVTCSP